MLPIRMGGNEDLVTGDLLRQFQSDLMCHLRGDGIIGTEGLYHVIVHPSVLLYCRLVFINSSRAAWGTQLTPEIRERPWYATLDGLQQ